MSRAASAGRNRRPASANNASKLQFARDDHIDLPWDKCLTFDLPTTRHHMMSHPTTIIATQHTMTHELDTQWTKVTQTPWTRKGKLLGGYGRKINTSTISNDAPLFFQNPERLPRPTNSLPPRDATIIGNRVPIKQAPDAALYLLPGGEGMIRARETRKTFDSFRTLNHGKQQYFENNITPRLEKTADYTPRTQMMIISSLKTAWPGAK